MPNQPVTDFTLPATGTIIILVNSIISFMVYSKKALISYFFSAASLLSQILLAIGGLLIVLLNL